MEKRQHKAFSAVMLTLILIGILAFAFNVQPAKSILPSSPPVQWTNTYDSSPYDVVYSVIQTSDGGYALAGYTQLPGFFNFGFWLVKTNSIGAIVWQNTYGGGGQNFATCVIETSPSDPGYALAGEGFANLVKTNPSGTMQWNRTYGGTGIYAFSPKSVIQTSDGGYALAGSILVSYPNWDMMLVKTDNLGYIQWTKTYGGTGAETAMSVIELSGGGYALTGYTFSYGPGWCNAWLVKTNSTGYKLWDKTYGVMYIPYSVIQTSDGGYALGGTTGADFCLVKTDSSGNMLWSKAYDDNSGVDWGYSLVQSSGGGYALAGYTESGSWYGANIWLIKTDAYGNLLWSARYATPTDHYLQHPHVIWTSDGGYAVAGTFNSASLGYPAYDFWLIKLSPILSATVLYTPLMLIDLNPNPDVKATIVPSNWPSPLSANDINPPSIRLGGTYLWDSVQTQNALFFKVTFARADVNSFISSLPVSLPTWISLTIIGTLYTGEVFEATATVYVTP